VGASVAQDRTAGNEDGGGRGRRTAKKRSPRGRAEAMIAWARSAEVVVLDNGQLESRAMRYGPKFMRLLTQAPPRPHAIR
jgi:hypothetical protein